MNVDLAAGADPRARILRTGLERVDQSFRIIAGERNDAKPALPDPIELSFYAVPGRLAGRDIERFFRIRLKRAYAALEAGRQGDFAISLAALEGMIEARATAYVSQPEDEDFKVQPADARFARLVLSAGDPFYYPHFERPSGFIDRTTGGEFALVYVDRACRISGRIRANDGVFRHELAFDKAGLYWVRIQEGGERGRLVSRTDPPDRAAVYVRSAR